MEKLSRVKKYADLRKSIETDNNIDKSLHAATSQEQEEALQKFDSSVFKKVEIQKEEAYTPKREQAMDPEPQEPAGKTVVDDTFTNEYLDDFIREVREYNIRKGNRESENTQADILYQLNAANRAKRSQYVQEIQDEEAVENRKSVVSKDDIALQVQNLLKEETLEEETVPVFEKPQPLPENEELPPVEESVEETRELQAQPEIPKAEAYTDKPSEEIAIVQEAGNGKAKKKVLQPLMMEELDEEDVVTAAPKKEPDVINKKLLEETQQLRVQMDEYEGELNELSGGMEKTNKLLNFVLCFLILVLLVIIGFIGYSLWKAGGL